MALPPASSRRLGNARAHRYGSAVNASGGVTVINAVPNPQLGDCKFLGADGDVIHGHRPRGNEPQPRAVLNTDNKTCRTAGPLSPRTSAERRWTSGCGRPSTAVGQRDPATDPLRPSSGGRHKRTISSLKGPPQPCHSPSRVPMRYCRPSSAPTHTHTLVQEPNDKTTVA